MSTEWYFRSGGQEHGPFSSSQLKQLAQQGRLKAEFPTRRGANGPWAAASTIDGLFEDSHAPPPVAPPRPQNGMDADAIIIHPLTWMAIGGGAIAVATLVAAIMGFFNGRSAEPSAAPAPVGTAAAQRETPQAKTSSTAASSQAAPVSISDIRIGEPQKQQLPALMSAEALYAAASPAVAKITVKNHRGKPIAQGSGFVLNGDSLRNHLKDMGDSPEEYAKSISEWDKKTFQPAYIVTNFHVLEGAVAADISLDNGAEAAFISEVVTESEDSDVAVLFVLVESDKPVSSLTLADSEPSIGTPVCAIGNPEGLANSFSRGDISGHRPVANGVSWLQTTTPISHGSSGGPLLTMDGRVVGITSLALQDAQNLNFAVSSSTIRRVLQEPFRQRQIWQGSSYLEAASDAQTNIKNAHLRAFAKAKTNSAEWWVKELLHSGEDEDSTTLSGRERQIEAATKALEGLHDDEKYFAYYVIGRESAAKTAAKTLATAKDFVSAYRNSDEGKAALISLQTAVQLKPGFAPAHAEILFHYLQTEEWAQALAPSESLLKLVPHCSVAHTWRAECLDGLTLYDHALKELDIAAELDPRDDSVEWQRGRVYSAMREWNKAAEAFEAAIRLDETGGGYYYFLLGQTQYESGKYEQAIVTLEKARKHGEAGDMCDYAIARCRHKLQSRD